MYIDIDKLIPLIIETADQEILPRFQHTSSHAKADGTPVTEADLSTQRRMTEALAALYPEIPLLGEEMPHAQQLQVLGSSVNGFWCLDPLDGTSNFVAGMPCFAVSLAYLKQGQVEAGIIYDPVRQECFHALNGQGAWLNGHALTLGYENLSMSESVAMVDFKRLPKKLASNLATQPPYRSQRSIGSVALDWCWLAAGRLQLYLHGGQRLWDFAAGRLIFAEAGGVSRMLDQSTQTESTTIDLQPNIAQAAVNQPLFDAWTGWIAAHG